MTEFVNENQQHLQEIHGENKSLNEVGIAKETLQKSQDTPERPDWLMDNFKTVEEQAKAAKDFREALSKKSPDAPEEYKLNLDQSLVEKYGLEDNEVLKEFSDLAKQANIPQKSFDKLVDFYFSNFEKQEAYENEIKKQSDEETKIKLGEHWEDRISNIESWAEKNLPENLYSRFSEMCQTAEDVEMFEALKGYVYEKTSIPGNLRTERSPINRDALMEKMNDPKYLRDAEFTRIVEEEYRRLSF
jgi:DNA mismatch repair ATPase MutS